jgi:hypothetical protein
MKKNILILQPNNMKVCFEDLLHSLRKKCKEQLPLDEERDFRSFAVNMPVDGESFGCHYIAFAVVCSGPVKHNGKQNYLASVEMHVLNRDTMMDKMLPLLMGHKAEVSEYLNQPDEVIVDQMRKHFESLTKAQ